MIRTRRQLGSALMLVLCGLPVAAQTTIEVGPLFGYYRPTGSFDPAPIHSVSLPGEPQDLSGGAWGAEARIWLGRRLGAEIQVMSAASTKGVVNTPAGPMGPISARVVTGTAQVLFDLLAGSNPNRVWLSAGPGLVRHGGDAYSAVGSQTDVAGVIGLGGSIPIAGGLSATAGVTGLFYSYDVPMPADLRLNGESLQKGAQQDALLHVGVNWAWH